MLDSYADLDLSPSDGDVETAELHFSEDMLVKAFALGPGATVEPHEHEDQTNAFHILEGTVTVLQGNHEEEIDAPGVVVHTRGIPHGARNDTDDIVVFTATMAPMG